MNRRHQKERQEGRTKKETLGEASCKTAGPQMARGPRNRRDSGKSKRSALLLVASAMRAVPPATVCTAG